jgi:hypothetical protein
MDTTAYEPVIKKALGKHWDTLADGIKKHYNLPSGQNDHLTLKGQMTEIFHSKMGKLFLLPGRIFGALVPHQGRAIPTEVKNWTRYNRLNTMFWHRTFYFPNKQPVVFQSRMEHLADNEIIEYVKYGMGIRMVLSEMNHSLVFEGKGYVWKIASFTLPIPNWLVLGNAKIIETAISDQELHLDFQVVHPLFGKTFSYSGIFSIQSAKTIT